ncbi:unnamed protein product [Didymodactylos carnosus]|uniref:Uncharacterized protein n=1 Tax=Didymodactylos carnosus TaxID=1234261 RepID=A0A8S2RG61_9BILA|nr:unnamed protein product [Didymodactylos carnosus]CAF4163815.1 unnamed protein product [Didymodactylos carnosus]
MTTINIHSPPDEVLFYANDSFYKFVEQCLGTDEMELIKIQGIKNTRTLIHLPNVLDVLKVECEALDDIQTRVCFKLKDNTYMVKPGVVAGVEDFVEALRAKDKEYLKKTEQQQKKSKRKTDNDKSKPSINQASPSQPLTANSSATPSLAFLSTNNSPSTPSEALPSINGCKQLINEFIEKWCKSYMPDILLHESNDYTLFVKESNMHLKCSCGIEMKLPFQPKTKTFQISSFYRHVKQTNCSMIKQKQNANQHLATNDQTKDHDQSDIAPVVEDVDSSQTQHSNSQSLSLSSSIICKNPRASLKRIHKSSLPITITSGAANETSSKRSKNRQ